MTTEQLAALSRLYRKFPIAFRASAFYRVEDYPKPVASITPGQYRVHSTSTEGEWYVVDLNDNICECNQEYAGKDCIHRGIALLHEKALDDKLIAALEATQTGAITVTTTTRLDAETGGFSAVLDDDSHAEPIVNSFRPMPEQIYRTPR